MKPLSTEHRGFVRTVVAQARLAAELMKPSGYAASALKADEVYLRGVANACESILNLIDPPPATAAEKEE